MPFDSHSFIIQLYFKHNSNLDLKNIVITPETDQALIPFIRAYQNHSMIPARADLLMAEYEQWEPYQLDGHCSLKGLALQAGYNATDYIKELRKAEKVMARVMEDDTND